MSSGRIVRTLVRALDRVLPAERDAKHLRTGRRGEEAAYFYLRERGYVMVARNWRSPRCHGELDLVGWEGDVLCFIEVKTRSSRAVAPAEAAVDEDKQQELAEVAREYLRRMPSDGRSRPRATGPRESTQPRAAGPRESTQPGAAGPQQAFTADTAVSHHPPQYRFDVVSVYVENSSLPPEITLYRNAFSLIK